RWRAAPAWPSEAARRPPPGGQHLAPAPPRLRADRARAAPRRRRALHVPAVRRPEPARPRARRAHVRRAVAPAPGDRRQPHGHRRPAPRRGARPPRRPPGRPPRLPAHPDPEGPPARPPRPGPPPPRPHRAVGRRLRPSAPRPPAASRPPARERVVAGGREIEIGYIWIIEVQRKWTRPRFASVTRSRSRAGPAATTPPAPTGSSRSG